MKYIKIMIPLLALTLIACNVEPSDSEQDPAPYPGTEEPEAPAETPVSPAPGDDDDSTDPSVTVPDVFEPGEYQLVEAFSGQTFSEPLALTYSESGDMLYVVERHGVVYAVSSSSEKEVFLDLTDVVNSSSQEMGLLGLAFHPDYDANGYLFVNYTKDGQTFISRFTHSGQAPVDLSTEKVILTYDQPFGNHNGGTILFGEDGYLYISSGDGGSGGDPQDNAQNLSSYLGKLLRIDIDSEDEPYLIPEDNPFIGEDDALGEIYAYGLRNPWKFSFDPGRNLLIAADVGQGEIEEISLIESGGNYGWNRYEGSRPYDDSSPIEDHILPVYEYPHTEGRSITGGFTYYGENLESLRGGYIYGDFVSGMIWALWLDENLEPENFDLLDTDLMISSFGLDRDGEIYIIDFRGKIYMLEEVN